MEPAVEALLDGEWESLCGMFNFEKELEHVMAAGNILDQGSSHHREHDERALDSLDLSSFYNVHHHLGANATMAGSANESHVLYSDEIPNDFGGGRNRTTVNKDVHVLPHVSTEEENLGVRSSSNYDASKENRLKRKLDILDSYARSTNGIGSSDINTEKKHRVPRQADGSCKRVGKSKKNQKVSPESNKEESNAWTESQNISSYSSDEENASQETNTVAALKGKTRASKGTATDPQSLYARKRRERINERLKILQNLVPNGTKVDISTMLEEAVHYVKFLQLQIKLLSSDDLWMYAPLAYNGLDMSLHHKLFSPLL